MVPAGTFSNLGSMIAGFMFVWAIFQQYFPHQLRSYLEKYFHRFFSFFYPYIQITFDESTGERFMRSEAYSAIESFLSSTSSSQAKRLRADIVKNSHSLVLSMDYNEEVAEEFKGVKLWWASGKHASKTQSLSFTPVSDERRYFRLTFHKRNRNLIIGNYLSHVMEEGKAIRMRNRQRKLFTNHGAHWRHVVFEHPATFQTLALEPETKKEIMEDLLAFSQAEDFYAKIGRAWKRGYLLYGPPGTGKSTMITAMANLLGYDIYDLELTAVKDNTELRRLLIETSRKSIIVIEDIDCSLDLTGQRRKKKEGEDAEEETDVRKKLMREENDTRTSQVTLSGILNFIDGLWSACGGERLIVFTTNHVEKLDPAITRKGRMDKHIELSYCSFEAFKMLAKNYLNLDSHHSFSKISQLIGEAKLTPADVAEHLMPKTINGNAEIYLEALIQALQKQKQKQKQEEEARVEPENDSCEESSAKKIEEEELRPTQSKLEGH